jgi:hypothetical protein
MALHRHRHLRKLGLPEFLFAVAVLATAATSIPLWRSLQGPNLLEAPGRVMTCRLVPTHYNAPPYENKAIMTYEYMVAGATFIASYEGFWPEGGGPNALMPDELDRLTQEGYPLTVLYRPGDPATSWLHTDIPGGKLPSALAFGAALTCSLLYCFWGYPAWRGR